MFLKIPTEPTKNNIEWCPFQNPFSKKWKWHFM